MSSFTINLDPVTLREATAQAIMGTLTPELREKILTAAVSNLLNPGSGWDSKRSLIQIAFDDAVSKVAKDLAQEYVKNDPAMMDRLRELVRKTADKLFNMDADKLAEQMADSFVRSIERER